MSTSFIEKYPQNKRSSIAIRPYVESGIDNMGLQKYNLSLFDGAFHEEPLTCLEVNGIARYLTGLNEFAPEIKAIANEDDRKAKIKQIRATVSELEKQLASNEIKPDDKEFWSKVKLLRSDNHEFWEKIKVRCSNEPVYLEPETDPIDLIIINAIKAGGFSIVAPSLTEAKRSAVPPKFYLDELEETLSTVTEVKKIRGRAITELTNLFDSNQSKLFLVAKCLDPNSAQYKHSTPNDIVYDNMERHIQGELVERDKRKCAQSFLDTAALDMQTLKIKAIVKDASFYKLISVKSDGHIYLMSSGELLGRTPSDVAEYLKNPLNEKVLDELMSKVEKFWNM